MTESVSNYYRDGIADDFIASFKAIQAKVHKTAQSKGWWDERDALLKAAKESGGEELEFFAKNVLKASMTALEHSELSESLEGVRKGKIDKPLPDDKIPEVTMEEAELADTIIRIMDKSEKYGLRVAEALVSKMAMNETREHKHGGKTM